MRGNEITPDLPPGMHELVSKPEGLRYALSIPDGYSPGSPSPLVTALHWGGPVAPYTGRALLEGLVIPALGDLNAIFLAPDRNGERWDDAEREAEALGMIDEVEGIFPIDPRRTCLTGYSLGGIGTWYMTGNHPDRFAAALPVSAAPPEDLSNRDPSPPLYVLHSTHDEIFPHEPVRTAVEGLRQKGADVELNMISGVTHFDVAGFTPHLAKALPWLEKVWG